MKFDIVVVGAGHAGCETAHAAARLGMSVAVATMDKRNIGFMPCNPSIGGTAKGHLVCEIDALGGLMGVIADQTAIQIRMLNGAKGSAVASLRAQIDKDAYHNLMQRTLEETPNLTIIEDEVLEIITGTHKPPASRGKEHGVVDNTPIQGDSRVSDTEGGQKHSQRAVESGGRQCVLAGFGSGVQLELNSLGAADISPQNALAGPAELKCLPIITGVRTKNNGIIECSAVVVATGVYLQGKTFVGSVVKNEGPSGFPAANALTKSLLDLGLEIRRFKTGTPARVERRSIDFTETQVQHGDDGIRPFSFIHSQPVKNTAMCHLTYTNPTTHQIIRDNVHRSAMYGGLIVGVGPRYCPSIEDKVMRFADRSRHQIFLEPETLTGNSIYLQGISSSLPADIQGQFIHTIEGLRNAEIIKHGYAIEYDCINSLQLLPTLEYKNCRGLFFAGQINGTSGYEEAAAQGLVAGVNAAYYHKNTISCGNYDNNNTNMLLSRTNSYIGVLIDDLTTVGTNEPYRMFTARAEHRLALRQDNADTRLTPIGRALGLVDDHRWKVFEDKQRQLDAIRGQLTPREQERLKKPGEVLNLPHRPAELCRIIETEIKYAGYLARGQQKIAEAKRQEQTLLPHTLDYASIKGLRIEARVKLNQIQPTSIGQAGRIPGVTPADIAVLLIHLKSKKG